jgi:hypothetical protein
MPMLEVSRVFRLFLFMWILTVFQWYTYPLTAHDPFPWPSYTANIGTFE